MSKHPRKVFNSRKWINIAHPRAMATGGAAGKQAAKHSFGDYTAAGEASEKAGHSRRQWALGRLEWALGRLVAGGEEAGGLPQIPHSSGPFGGKPKKPRRGSRLDGRDCGD